MVVKIVIETVRVFQTNNINCRSVFLRWMACAPYVKAGWIAIVLSHRDWVRRHACLQLATGRMSHLPCLFTHYSRVLLDLSFSYYLHYPIGLPYDLLLLLLLAFDWRVLSIRHTAGRAASCVLQWPTPPSLRHNCAVDIRWRCGVRSGL